MTRINDVRKLIRDIVAVYFGDAHVFATKSKRARTVDPYVTIDNLSYERQLFPTDLIDVDGEVVSSREITAAIQIDIYTKGRNIAEANQAPVYENTALDDMEDLLAFLDSEIVTTILDFRGIYLHQNSEIRDLSSIINDSAYQYRSSVDVEIHFTVQESGRFGQNRVEELPNSSGGGSPDMVTEPLTIEEITILGGTKE